MPTVMGVPAAGSATPYAAFQVPAGVVTPTTTPGAAVLASEERTAASSLAVSSAGSGVVFTGVDPAAMTFSTFATHCALSAAYPLRGEIASKQTEPTQRATRSTSFFSMFILQKMERIAPACLHRMPLAIWPSPMGALHQTMGSICSDAMPPGSV